MKKALCYILLTSLMLHSMSRLGFLDYLYQQRHQIAFSVGLISEIPIAMCNSDYDFGKGLTIQHTEDSDKSIPPTIFQAREIHLFFEPTIINNTPQYAFLREGVIQGIVESEYTPPATDIFHPPA